MSEANDYNPAEHVSTRFFAWCPETSRLEALVAAVRTLATPPTSCTVMHRVVSAPDAMDMLRTEYELNESAMAFIDLRTISGQSIELGISACADHNLRRERGPIEGLPWSGGLLPDRIRLTRHGRAHALEIGATIACHMVMIDIQDIVLRVCTSHPAIVTGGCSRWDPWEAPVSMGTTYNADGCIARDLVLSWIHLHDNAPLETNAGLPMGVLRQCVESAPTASSISIPHRGDLTREQVLAVLNLPPAELLEAMDACAIPDGSWQISEPAAQHYLIEGWDHQSALAVVRVDSREHVRFIADHAPFEVLRLPNGGVMLATHPYRTLWPLWSSALDLLGIRPQS